MFLFCFVFFRRAWPGCRERLPGSGSSFSCKQKHKQSESLWVCGEICSGVASCAEVAHLSLLTLHVYHIDRVDKKRDKIERKILDSQERAFWDVHRPVVSKLEGMFPWTHVLGLEGKGALEQTMIPSSLSQCLGELDCCLCIRWELMHCIFIKRIHFPLMWLASSL